MMPGLDCVVLTKYVVVTVWSLEKGGRILKANMENLSVKDRCGRYNAQQNFIVLLFCIVEWKWNGIFSLCKSIKDDNDTANCCKGVTTR